MQPDMMQQTVGVVLAGGAGRRMGGEKARLEVDGKTLVDRALALLDGELGEVALSVARAGLRLPGRSVVVDNHPGCGPLAGLEATLAAFSGRPVFLLACDLPLVEASVVRRVLATAGDAVMRELPAAWLARAGERRQPLCGVYSAATLGPARRQLEHGERSMAGLLDRLEVTEVVCDDLGPDLLLNVNRPADLARAAELLDGR